MAPARPIAEPPTPRHIPWATLLLCVATLALSIHAAIEISGTWFGKVRIVQLEDYGLRFSHLRDFELWRLVTAQLVHVKQAHMLGSVFCLLLVGAAVERHVGFVRLFLLWLVGGSLATLISPIFIQPPWNLGTGASQAIMAIVGAGLWLARSGIDRSKSLLWPMALSITMTFGLDLIFSHYPKPGHVAGLVLGYSIASLGRKRA